MVAELMRAAGASIPHHGGGTPVEKNPRNERGDLGKNRHFSPLKTRKRTPLSLSLKGIMTAEKEKKTNTIEPLNHSDSA
jgi:hypothetical protein